MKLIYLTPGIFNSGGTERVLSIKANYLVDVAGFEVIIITTDQKKRKCFFDFDKRIKHYDLGINFCDDTSLSLLKFYQVRRKKNEIYRKRLEELIRKESPDVCISLFGKEFDFLPSLNISCKIIAELHFNKKFREKSYLSLHKGVLWRFIAKIRTRQLVKTSRKYDKVIVLTKEDLCQWNKTNNNVIQIYNPLPYQTQQTSELTNKSFISVGRLSSQKNYESLISAWSIVHNMYPDWQMNIWGDGELKDFLRNKIRTYNVEDSFILRGKTDRIDKEYLKNSAFVMSSRYEGFPMVLLEAASFGLPLISYDCYTGPKDIIDDGVNGFLVPFNNEEALSDAMCKIIKSSELRKEMGMNAKVKSLDFSQDKILPQWPVFFYNLLK